MASKTIPQNAIIQEFGLPVGFPDEEVPLSVAEFCFETANRPLAYALDLAARRGFYPLCRPVPCAEPGVVGLGLAVDGQFVPLMVKLAQKN